MPNKEIKNALDLQGKRYKLRSKKDWEKYDRIREKQERKSAWKAVCRERARENLQKMAEKMREFITQLEEAGFNVKETSYSKTPPDTSIIGYLLVVFFHENYGYEKKSEPTVSWWVTHQECKSSIEIITFSHFPIVINCEHHTFLANSFFEARKIILRWIKSGGELF